VSGPSIPFECTGEVVEIQHAFEASRVFPMDPTGYVDRRIVVVHIRPENPAALAPYSQAHVTIKIEVP